jgi:HEAT repeat protein
VNRHRNLRFAAVVVAFVAVSTASASDGGVPSGTPLCPAVTNPRTVVKIDGVEVRAAASAEATAEALAMLTWLDRDQRLRSAISLGLAGNVEALHRILESRDLANLSTYGRFYVNPERTACVGREVEDAVLAHMADPELRPSLTAFFEKNIYQRRELFDTLVRVDFDDGKPDDFNRVVMALLATRLEEIEDEVLAQAERHLEHDTPVRKRVLPGVHRRYVEFFGERRYEPAIGYMEALLRAEGYEGTLDSFVSEFSQTRSRVYRTLDGFASPEVAEIFTRQLRRVVDSCPSRFVLYELGAFGSFAIGHAATAEQRLHITESLAMLLGLWPPSEPVSTMGGRDDRTHKKLVELLSELGTTEAAAVLVADLDRLVGLDDPETAESLMVSVFEALRSLPETTELDVPAFLAVASKLPDRFRLYDVPTILDAHPDPAATAFYLDQVRWIVDNWDGFESRYRIEPDAALAVALDRLMEVEEPEDLVLIRDEVDALYRHGRLEESRYVVTSDRLNELIGDESATYLGLQESRRMAREAEIQRRRDEQAAEWDRIVEENLSDEGILANVQALGGRTERSKMAASWLVITGADALDPIHDALVDSTLSDGARITLLQVIGEIGDSRSVQPMIDFIKSNADSRTFLGGGLRALALMPTSPETLSFARELLEVERSPLVRKQALVYLASVREPAGLGIARALSDPDTDPDVRVAALLLLARLRDAEARPAVVEMLVTTDNRSYRDVLLRALAELSTPETFEAFGDENPALRGTESFRDMRPLVVFRHAEGEQKLEAARHLVNSGHPWDRRDGLGFLVEAGHTEVLFGYLQFGPYTGQPFSGTQHPLLRTVLHSPRGVQVYAQIRRMGYLVKETPDGLKLVRSP